jgi:hypothetical protein
MSDGRFAVLGGTSSPGLSTSSCEALAFNDGGAHWAPLPLMHDARKFFACGLSAGASSSPVGLVSNQLKCTTRSSIGGCGFRAACLTKVGSMAWAARRFCRTIPGTYSQQ